MLVASTVPAVRIVALPAALDAFSAPPHKLMIRVAPDEIMLLHTALAEVVFAGDEHAILEAEFGFSVIGLSWAEFEQSVRPLIEWRVPSAGFPCLAQGLVGFVPAKLWFTADGVRIIVATSFAETLLERMRSQ